MGRDVRRRPARATREGVPLTSLVTQGIKGRFAGRSRWRKEPPPAPIPSLARQVRVARPAIPLSLPLPYPRDRVRASRRSSPRAGGMTERVPRDAGPAAVK